MDKTTAVLAVLMIAVIMAAADSSVVLLAFPSLTQELNTNVSYSIWTIFAYMLVTAIVTTQLGRLGDIYGRAKMFNLGFIVFTAASALCGAAPTIFYLIGFRVLQGIGAAMLLANSGAIVADTFPREKLGRAYGYIASGWGIGSLLGIILGGVLTTLLGWRYVFYINVPIGIVAIALGLLYIRSKTTMKRQVDVLGMLLFGSALAILAYDAISVASFGFTYFDGLLILISALLVIGFLYKERRTKDPLIDLSLFENKVLKYSLLASLFLSTSMFSIFFLVTLYLQGVLGLNPLDAALYLTPGSLLGAVLSPKMGRLSDKLGHGAVATAGVFCFAVAILIYLTIGPTSTPYIVAVAAVASGFGTALFYPANNAAVMSNAKEGYYGSINGLLRTFQNTGGILSYVIVIYVAASSVPRAVAFQVFVGTTQLIGGLTSQFVDGIHAALLGLLVLVFIAGVFSYIRSKK